MSRTIKGIPTLYKGTRFRSRLEARWAVLFDSLGWPWLYEPIDLSWYIPDFLLTFDAGHIAVEVKSEVRLRELDSYAERMILSGWDAEVLVLGAAIHDENVIGIGGEIVGPGDLARGPAEVFRCISCGHVSLLNADQGWRCRVSGCYDGRAHIAQLEPGELAGLWATAGNRVQWKADPLTSDEVR